MTNSSNGILASNRPNAPLTATPQHNAPKKSKVKSSNTSTPKNNGLEQENTPEPERNKTKDKSSMKSKPASQKHQATKPKCNTELYIVGDSILKNLDGRKMSRNKQVKIWSIPGCTSSDMHHHIQPLLNRNPEEIIVHVGTNSLRTTRSAQECAEEIVHVASLIRTQKNQANYF